MVQLRLDWGGRCVMADGTPHMGRLEFAHLPGKPTGVCGRGRGRTDRYYDVKRNPECYVLLCRSHHRRIDERHWDYGAKQDPRELEAGEAI